MIAVSVNGVPIRLTDERWFHIIDEHGELNNMITELIDSLEKPERILAGNNGEFLAIKQVMINKYLIVVYKEINSSDGFVITAF